MRHHLKTAAILAAFALALSAAAPRAPAKRPSAARYLAYARASADWTWQHFDELVERSIESFDPKNVFGYRAPGSFWKWPRSAWLYEKEKKPEYAERAKKVLLTYGDFRTAFPGMRPRRSGPITRTASLPCPTFSP